MQEPLIRCHEIEELLYSKLLTVNSNNFKIVFQELYELARHSDFLTNWNTVKVKPSIFEHNKYFVNDTYQGNALHHAVYCTQISRQDIIFVVAILCELGCDFDKIVDSQNHRASHCFVVHRFYDSFDKITIAKKQLHDENKLTKRETEILSEAKKHLTITEQEYLQLMEEYNQGLH